MSDFKIFNRVKKNIVAKLLIFLNSPRLFGLRAVMRHWRFVLDASDVHPLGRKSSYGRFPAGADSFNYDIRVFHAHSDGFLPDKFANFGGRERSAFLGALKAQGTA